eukprot:CAMPEP_0204234066 /NCGR_PEP_ID=MMETSP0361-20130328/90692_1 /ASSEMBLY_ACC=CAM_ASM_000343 /TAXON_ID=268821 /ORGANISM="Scrippsiella Hangoei, Strain SHTV-5" /LENGTH=100 /DNA_ID=CAMNT_0051204873 /DNA_START=453 /DNA_END=755 /DNA_ORIENTATION=+
MSTKGVAELVIGNAHWAGVLLALGLLLTGGAFTWCGGRLIQACRADGHGPTAVLAAEDWEDLLVALGGPERIHGGCQPESGGRHDFHCSLSGEHFGKVEA